MEIFNNTLIKWIFRQGSDLERQNIVFSSGEPAFTTDTYRMFVGTGSLSGGKPVGNISLGTTTDLTSLDPGIIGDFAYNSDSNSFFWIVENDGATITDWIKIGGVYSASSPISINSSNLISLNALSANSLDPDSVQGPIILNSGRITLSANIPHQTVSTKTITASGGLVSTANGVSSTGSPVNPLSANITIQSNQIYARYYGPTSTLSYSRNITSVSNLSTGHYRFVFGPLTNVNYIPTTQIMGLSALGYFTRVINQGLSSCDVVVLSSNNTKIDTDIALLINY